MVKYKFKDTDATKLQFVYESENNKGILFSGKVGEILPDTSDNTIKIGIGKEEGFCKFKLQENAYKAIKKLVADGIKELAFPENTFGIEDKEYVLLMTEAMARSLYVFDKYKSEKKPVEFETAFFPTEYEEYSKEAEELRTVIKSSFVTRDLVNTRSNEIYPETLAEAAKETLKDTDVKVSIYDYQQIKDMGMNALLSVGQGSEREARFIVMEYMNGGDEKPLAFVGKGLTYDTGGYSLKPSDFMDTMFSDMAGSATVIGAMRAIATNKLDVNVVAVVGAVENCISGKAIKPGDIIESLSGKTIEISNTDAEGRVTLADTVYYTVDKYEPRMLVDLATLTGACLIALGETYTGAVTNNQEAMNKVLNAAKVSNEKIWQLPTDDVFKEYNKSEVADINNTGGRLAGTISAGLFIGEFVKNTPWVHLDIAGTAFLSKEQGIYDKNASGVLVKTLYNLAKENN